MTKDKKKIFLSIKNHEFVIFVVFSFAALMLVLYIVRFSVAHLTHTKELEYISINNPEAIEDDNELSEKENTNFVKWMEFEVPLEVLEQAYSYDIKSYNEEIHFDWVKLIAYGAAKNWGTFKKNKKCAEIDELVKQLKEGKDFDELVKNMKLYEYYYNTYSAVLSGYVGEYEVETTDSKTGKKIYVRKYGLKVFSPVAKGYGFSNYDDFGVSRSYGYKRKHLGNDIMGSVGTPIIAMEDGYIEALGWNQYGGWRVGIRSADNQRYYYYAHLRKDHPFHKTLKAGDKVLAGDVIGYLGMTGYSKKENVNNINIPHLHLGIQIIFNEKQKEGNNQIWINIYNIVRFLNKNRMSVYKNAETKDFYRSITINTDIYD